MHDNAQCCNCAAKFWQALGFYKFQLPGGVKFEPSTYFLRTSTIDDQTLDLYFPKGAGHNIGYRLGFTPLNNRVLIDVDTKPGQNGLQTIVAASGFRDFQTLIDATDALVIQTPSGGFHLIYDAGPDEYSQSSGLWESAFGKGHGIDIRSRHGYALAPGSWLRRNPAPTSKDDFYLEPDRAQYHSPTVNYPRDYYRLWRAPRGLRVKPLPDAFKRFLVPITPAESKARPSIILDAHGNLSDCFNGASDQVFALNLVANHAPHCFQGSRDIMTHKLAVQLGTDMGHSVTFVRQLLEVYNNTKVHPPLEDKDLDRLARQSKKGSGVEGSMSSAAIAPGAVGAEEVLGAEASKRKHEEQQAVAKRGRGTRFKVRMASDDDEQPVEWLVPGLIARGHLGLLMGAGGKGKSQLTLAVAAALSRGSQLFPDAPPPFDKPLPKGRTLLITFEDNWKDTILPRFQAAGADRSMVGQLEYSAQKNKEGQWEDTSFDIDKDVPGFAEYLDAHPDTLLTIIDPINAYLGAKADSFKTSDVRRVLEPFGKVAQDRGVSVLGIIHPNKKREGAVVDWATGAGGFTQLARTVTALLDDPEDENWREEDRINPRQVWTPAKRNIGGKDAHSIVFDIEGYQYVTKDYRHLIDTSRVKFLKVIKGGADAVAERLADMERERKDKRLSENKEKRDGKAAPYAHAKQIVRDSINAEYDGAPTMLEVVKRGESANVSKTTMYNAIKEMVVDGEILDIIGEVGTRVLKFVNLGVRNSDIGQPRV